MGTQGYSDELDRPLARPEADRVRRQLQAYAQYSTEGGTDWPDEFSDDFEEITSPYDPEKALAYVIIAVSQSGDAKFLARMGCGNLEEVLRDPSPDLLERIVAEARKSARFRWVLSNPWKIAIAERSWNAIHQFRITGPAEEPLMDTLPPRCYGGS
jgi:hypothetical protein